MYYININLLKDYIIIFSERQLKTLYILFLALYNDHWLFISRLSL